MPISNKQQLNTKKKANERVSYKDENILDKDWKRFIACKKKNRNKAVRECKKH